MKAAPLLVHWHEKAPIYSTHFEPHGKGRLATAGGDNNVRLWRIEPNGDERKVTHLSTLAKHTQAVNVVRWSPRGELLASAGDDGNVLLWAPSEPHTNGASFGEDATEDKETWIVKRMCRSSSGSEIYDLAWSPDGLFFVTGSMDNVARIFDAQTGQLIRQIAEHNHYVQGVAWDPLNEFLATQSSDRSVHIYKLRTNDGQFSLAHHGRMSKMDLPARRPSSNSPAPPDFGHRSLLSSDNIAHSPAPSAPSTPQSLALPMNPPSHMSQSRRSSFGAPSPSIRRSASPAPSMPLPAVMPPASPNLGLGIGVRNASIYANETLTSFFRRLTFAPDGSLLFTPAGQYKTLHPSATDAAKTADDIINTVYIYSRAGLNKPPIAHLPGHKKPSVAVRCCPTFFNLRLPAPTKQITIDTSSTSEDIAPLPEPVLPSRAPPSVSSMEPPPFTGVPSPAPSTRGASPRPADSDSLPPSDGPPSAFALPYRIVYAVATQDAVYVYDTQQQSPLCEAYNLHPATFTDLTWTADGTTLIMSSSDGFCSSLAFAPGELGTHFHGPLHSRGQHPTPINTSSSPQPTPQPTPIATTAPVLAKQPPSTGVVPSSSSTSAFRPASPTRTNSASSIATQSSVSHTPAPGVVVSNPTPSLANLPGVAATNTGSVTGVMPLLTAPTPPMTPHAGISASSSNASFPSSAGHVLGKREGESDPEEGHAVKKRRIAPTLVSASSDPHAGDK